jgi:hypothetical protein
LFQNPVGFETALKPRDIKERKRLPGAGEPHGGESECAAENGSVASVEDRRPGKTIGPSRKMFRATLSDDFPHDVLFGKVK